MGLLQLGQGGVWLWRLLCQWAGCCACSVAALWRLPVTAPLKRGTDRAARQLAVAGPLKCGTGRVARKLAAAAPARCGAETAARKMAVAAPLKRGTGRVAREPSEANSEPQCLEKKKPLNPSA